MSFQTQAVKDVLDLIDDYHTDTEDPFGKPWLIEALVSYISREKKLPKEFVKAIVSVCYLADNL